MNKILSLNNVYDSTDIKSLENLFDTIETQVRSLNSLGYDYHSYGRMLIPILLLKLPTNLNLEISRRFGKNVWDIKLIIDTLRKEIQARGKIVSVSDAHSCLGEGFTGVKNLFAGKGNLSKLACLFCNKTNHLSHKCRTVLNPQARKVVVMKNSVFYI